MQETFVRLCNFIVESFPHLSEVTLMPETNLRNELGINSLRLVDTLVALEERFEVQFDESDLDPSRLETVADLLRILENALGLRQA